MRILLNPITEKSLGTAALYWLRNGCSRRRVLFPLYLVFRHGGRFTGEWKMVRRSRVYSVAFERKEAFLGRMSFGAIGIVAVYDDSDSGFDVLALDLVNRRERK